MNTYLLTNKDTHARAFVIAESEQAARERHPNGTAVWDPLQSRWYEYQHATHTMHTVSVPWWPDDLERVHADYIGPARASDFKVAAVLVCEADEQKRVKGEGPDDSWGFQG